MTGKGARREKGVSAGRAGGGFLEDCSGCGFFFCPFSSTRLFVPEFGCESTEVNEVATRRR